MAQNANVENLMEGSMELTSRPLTEGDLPAVLRLQREYDLRFFGEPLLTADDISAQWRTPEFRLDRDSEAWVTPEGQVLGYATLDPDGTLDLGVSAEPAISWLTEVLSTRWERTARRRGLESVQRTVAADDAEGLDALQAEGYRPHHTTWILVLAGDLPEGRPARQREYRIEPLTDADAPAVHTLVAGAFAEWGGGQTDYAGWRAAVLDRPDVVPGHCRVARLGPELVGACLATDPAVGSRSPLWVTQLAVRPDHRRRGVARELLVQTTLAARCRGVAEVGLATDTRAGARGFYERLGMAVRHTLHTHALQLEGPS